MTKARALFREYICGSYRWRRAGVQQRHTAHAPTQEIVFIPSTMCDRRHALMPKVNQHWLWLAGFTDVLLDGDNILLKDGARPWGG